ncbi:MAG: ABC transporter ATP-binding protein [Rhodospirillaceae bacterium]|nr:ABC transporter ATP-binding protein [Rhodospirillaceae bacterium]
MQPVIAVESVSKSFGAVTAVNGVTLDVRPNECLALLGPSGCGKTTLLRLIAGLEAADRGRILIDGADMTHAAPYARPVNMMFQSYALFPHMSVADNVAFGLKQDGVKGDALKARVQDALAAVEMEALAQRMPAQLSGGQKQRAALARCLAKRPRALLLDEPMAALDKHLRERTQFELMALRKRLGIAFVVVTHDQSEAMAMADRVAVMDAGHVLQVAAPREMYERPASRRVAQFFGDINVWSAVVGLAPGTVDIPDLRLAVRIPAALPSAGSPLSVALRPERIAIARDPAPMGDCSVSGTIEDAVYLGMTCTYFVTLSSGAVVRVTAQNGEGAQTFSRGDAVHLSWRPAALTVLAA